jgi:hypothetical protein
MPNLYPDYTTSIPHGKLETLEGRRILSNHGSHVPENGLYVLDDPAQGAGLVETGAGEFSDTCSRCAFPTGIYNMLPYDHPIASLWSVQNDTALVAGDIAGKRWDGWCNLGKAQACVYCGWIIYK